MKGPTGMQTA